MKGACDAPFDPDFGVMRAAFGLVESDVACSGFMALVDAIKGNSP